MKNNTQILQIFGYGSLMHPDSLRKTVPNARNLRTAYIKGFIREFSLLDTEKWNGGDPSLTPASYCAVDIIPDIEEKPVNGILFEIDQEDLIDLRLREHDYELIETAVYDFVTHELIGVCYVFSANKRSGSYIFGEPVQERYLQICSEAAKANGVEFYKQFLATTFIHDKSLEELQPLKMYD